MRIIFLLLNSLLVISCGGYKFVGDPAGAPLLNHNKKESLGEDERKFWPLMDLRNDSIAGMSVARAHAELIKDQKGEKVIVAVIDSGVDIEHPQLQEVIWINRDEVPNNNIDDDNNGYVDDRHGWNFLGAANHENMESVRLQKKEKPGSEAYKKFEEKRLKSVESKKNEVVGIQDMLAQIKESDSIIKLILGKEDYTLEEVEGYSPKTFALMEALIFQRFLEENLLTKSKLEVYLEGAQTGVNAHYNIAFDGRAVVGDDPDDINDTLYGNPNVIGPDKDAANHGTHVSGIIAAVQNNNPGNKSNFEGTEIMVLRAVPDGDEYDKDIALAIRYAVDNGAKIINTSFGKGYSPHKDWVWEAVRHAEKNDVLIINAAGNSGKNIDPGMEKTYITDEENGIELFTNFLTVGAVGHSYNEKQVASFSNFGAINVDVFAPGDKIWSTVPHEKYDFYSGTSMAAPNAAGVAAIIRSFFPKLKAFQVKRILMDSGLPMYPSLKSPEGETLVNPRSLSASGKTINLYNALIYASNKSYKK